MSTPTVPSSSKKKNRSQSSEDKMGGGVSVAVISSSLGVGVPSEAQRVDSRTRRTKQMERLLNTQPVDLDALFTISRMEGGFLTNELRRRIWPKFFAVNRYNTPDFRVPAKNNTSSKQQIRCDVERSFWNFLHCKEWPSEKLDEKRALLTEMITATLVRNPELHYYQGFHDVSVVFIEIFEDEPDLAFSLIETASKHFLKDFMGEDFQTVTNTLPLILQIIKKVDVKLFAFLSKALTEPYFATSWLITWFAHDVKDLNTVARIFDGLITSHPLFCLYISTAIVLSCKKDIFAMDCEMSQIHNFLVNICDRDSISFDEILVKADRLMSAFPPDKLKKLASQDLRYLISNKQVALFLKPPCITRYCDTDGVLLEDTKRRKAELVAEKENALLNKVLDEESSRGNSGAAALSWLSNAVVEGITNLTIFKKEEEEEES